MKFRSVVRPCAVHTYSKKVYNNKIPRHIGSMYEEFSVSSQGQDGYHVPIRSMHAALPLDNAFLSHILPKSIPWLDDFSSQCFTSGVSSARKSCFILYLCHFILQVLFLFPALLRSPLFTTTSIFSFLYKSDFGIIKGRW